MQRTLVFLCAAVMAETVRAAAIYGSITVDGRSAGSGIDVELVCAGQVIGKVTSDTRGTYQVIAPGSVPGSCVVRMEGAVSPVVFYANPKRYDFSLSHQGGRAVLTQR